MELGSTVTVTGDGLILASDYRGVYASTLGVGEDGAYVWSAWNKLRTPDGFNMMTYGTLAVSERWIFVGAYYCTGTIGNYDYIQSGK
ncbi:hypothetical protein KIPB_014674, partial [Kipferlia bialata]|eukprot:g14674.t1